MNHKPKIAVIGAGMAGITCARKLMEAGLMPVVFEKSRGLGGRMATRRVSDAVAFDHGAQYFTVRNPDFAALIDELRAFDAAAVWKPRSDAGIRGNEDWIVGQGAMNALLKPLAVDMDVRLNTHVHAVERAETGWTVSHDDVVQNFDVVVLTVPVIQLWQLLVTELDFLDSVSAVDMAPCWALMVAFEHPVECGFDVLREDKGAISWIARNTSKPGRSGQLDCWVAHASPGWSTVNLEQDREKAADLLLPKFLQAFSVDLPVVKSAQAHRWRYSRTTIPLGRPFVALSDDSLFAGGDWTLGARVECAFESGAAMAAAVIGALGR